MKSMDIGIIGGADGPTVIFMTGSIWPIIVTVGIIIAIVVIGAIIWRRNHRKK